MGSAVAMDNPLFLCMMREQVLASKNKKATIEQ